MPVNSCYRAARKNQQTVCKNAFGLKQNNSQISGQAFRWRFYFVAFAFYVNRKRCVITNEIVGVRNEMAKEKQAQRCQLVNRVFRANMQFERCATQAAAVISNSHLQETRK